MPAPTHLVLARTYNGPSNQLEAIFLAASDVKAAGEQVAAALRARPGSNPWRFGGLHSVVAIPQLVSAELATVATVTLEMDND